MANIWKKTEVEKEKLPAKADSLPRNIQLNDQIESLEKTQSENSDTAAAAEEVSVTEIEEQHEG